MTPTQRIVLASLRREILQQGSQQLAITLFTVGVALLLSVICRTAPYTDVAPAIPLILACGIFAIGRSELLMHRAGAYVSELEREQATDTDKGWEIYKRAHRATKLVPLYDALVGLLVLWLFIDGQLLAWRALPHDWRLAFAVATTFLLIAAAASVPFGIASITRQPANTPMPDPSSLISRPAPPHPPDRREPSEPSRDARVEILLADFTARWQELLNFETEVSRWFTLYVTAVIAVIGWTMGNIPATGIQALLKQHDGLNTVFVLTLSLLNPVYILALAFNGYRIQQIGQYLYSHVGVRLSILTNEPFNVWEDWRRQFLKTPGTYGPEWIRRVYYFSIAIVPAFVSGLLLVAYWWFEGSTQARWSGHNCFAYVVVAVNITAASLSILTSAQNDQWNSLINRRFKEEGAHGVVRPPFLFADTVALDRQTTSALPSVVQASSVGTPAASALQTNPPPTRADRSELGRDGS